jgi:hypothetical protein
MASPRNALDLRKYAQRDETKETTLMSSTTADPWRMAEWNGLADECLIAGCGSEEIDQRGPVWLRNATMHKACVEHWEGIMSVLGEQGAWERTDGSRQTPEVER